MSDEAINRAIAEHLGYYVIEPPEADGTRAFRLICPAGQNWTFEWRETESEAWADAGEWTSDLNAMHSAEETLDEQQRADFADHLFHLMVCDENHGPGFNDEDIMLPSAFSQVHIPALMRATAFVKALGKWQEEKQ
jgi:hypothetical protein